MASPALTFGLLAGAAIGYSLVLAANPVRSSLRDGLRCLRRYHQLWTIPLAFGLCYAAFRVVVHAYEASFIPNGSAAFAPWLGLQPADVPLAAGQALLTALLGTAGVFNFPVIAFPLSAIGALLFIVNWHGYHGVLARAVRRRFGGLGSVMVEGALILCALAAMVQPWLFLGGLMRLKTVFGDRAGSVIGAATHLLGSVFDILLATGLQVYLVLLAFVWVRGLTFDYVHLRQFALRRSSFVLKWAGLVLAASLVLQDLPLAFATASGDSWISEPALGSLTVLQMGWWVLGMVLVAFCSVQITLIFHSESLRQAVRDHFHFLRVHGVRAAWFTAIAGIHFFLLGTLDGIAHQVLGEHTLPDVAWRFCYATLWAALSAWLVASWVCLFRRCEMGRSDAQELVKF